MDHKPYLLWLLMLGLLLYLPLSVQARDVYKWLDSNGVTHYSQTPPKQTETQTEIVQLEITKPESKSVDQTLSTLEIANQFEKARLAREKARFDRRLAQARLELETQRSELEQDDSVDVRYVSVFYPRFKHRHKHRHKNCKSKRIPGCGKGHDRHQQLRKKHELVTTRSNQWRLSKKTKLNY
ncbi:MAG: DUF4124 domain-containing protein [Thioalkalispiraceae bacterium]|jgi:hypothetical protein